MEIKGLLKYNRPQLVKLLAAKIIEVEELKDKNRVLNEAIEKALDDIEDLRRIAGKEGADYEYELHTELERDLAS